MKNHQSRRHFLSRTGKLLAGTAFLGSFSSCSDLLKEEDALAMAENLQADTDLFFKISLAEWSLHRTLWAGEMDHLRRHDTQPGFLQHRENRADMIRRYRAGFYD